MSIFPFFFSNTMPILFGVLVHPVKNYISLCPLQLGVALCLCSGPWDANESTAWAFWQSSLKGIDCHFFISSSWCLKCRHGDRSFSSHLVLWGYKPCIRWWWRKKELLARELLSWPGAAYLWLIWNINKFLSCSSFPYQQMNITAYAYIMLYRS